MIHVAKTRASTAVSPAGHRTDGLCRRPLPRLGKGVGVHAGAPAAPPGDVPPPQTLEEESLLYEETPVQIISLLDLEPVDTRASANPVRVGGGTLDPVDQAEMASVLAECTLKDNTIVRLYVTAEGLIDGAFLRPGAGWIRFARLYRGADQGPNYAETAALTACSGILGHDGFLLRTDGHCSGVYSYDYYWFDTAGDLQVLTARMDPVALDLDGDGTAELVWEIAEWQGAFSFYFRRTDGAICCVTPSEYIDASGLFLAAVEQEGPGPVRLIYRYHGTDEDQEQFCAVTFRDGALEIEMDLVYVPASLEDTVPLSDPTAGGAALPHVSITGPDGWTMDGAGEAAYLDLWSLLWNSPYPSSKGAVIVPTDAPLDAETTYTVTFSDPQAGNSFSWSLDAEGICRLDGIEGNCRMVSTGVGSLPAYCHDVLELYCRASRTARNYDAQGRWLGWDLVPDTVAPG